ncbi:MAG: hypothetical protein M1840_007045 [Geoglossum simile]|nr:MAG: hypothetical protein M1840_007045 [Geoglossum simile]
MSKRDRSDDGATLPDPKRVKAEGGQEEQQWISAFPGDMAIPVTDFKQVSPLHATEFAGPYLPHFPEAWKLSEEQFQQFTGINCSYFSHTSGKAPTLNDIKNHARALARLIKTLNTYDIAAGIDPFDWLCNLDVPYSNSTPSHSKPLNALVNAIAVANEDAIGSRKITAGCALEERHPHSWRLAGHANDVLQRLDAMYEREGGLLGVLPAKGTPERENASKGILGQWIEHTQELTARVVELEDEVEHHRLVLSGEAMVPSQLHPTGELSAPDATAGRPLVFPQDRYILGSLSAGLWNHLDNMLNTRGVEAQKEEDEKARKLHRAASSTPEKEVHSLKRIAWLSVESRLYRVAGTKAIFIVPAWKISQELKGGREDEKANGPRASFRPPRLRALEKELEEKEKRIAELEAMLNTKTLG